MSAPPCMDAADYAAWDALNRSTRSSERADSPCRDCTAEYHRQMAAEGRCTGSPLAGDPPVDRGGRPVRAADVALERRRAQWRAYRRRRRAAA